MSDDNKAPTATPAATTTQRSLHGLGVAVASYLTAFGLLMAATLKLAGAATDALTWLICLLPAIVGAAAALSSTADSRQYTARLLAAAAMLPVLLLFWASSAAEERAAAPALWPLATWPWVTLTALLHAGAFVVMIMVAGRLLTRVAAVAGVAPVAADELLLRLSAATHSVHVQESLRAAGAKPQDASDADMRAPGEAAFDPARLAQTPWPGDAAAWASDDAEGCVTLACAVVTRSGWRWQPALFGG